MATLQWGHAEHSVEDVRTPASRQCQLRAPCFNGATLSTAWKTFVANAVESGMYYELQWGHADAQRGRRESDRSDRTRMRRFNGATLMHSVEDTNDVARLHRVRSALQWGHADAQRGRPGERPGASRLR